MLSCFIRTRRKWKHSERCGCLVLTTRLGNECVIRDPRQVRLLQVRVRPKKREEIAVPFSAHLCPQFREYNTMHIMLMGSAVSVRVPVKIYELCVISGWQWSRLSFQNAEAFMKKNSLNVFLHRRNAGTLASVWVNGERGGNDLIKLAPVCEVLKVYRENT